MCVCTHYKYSLHILKALAFGVTAVVVSLTYLRIIVIVAFLFSPWKGREPVSISYCTHTRTVYNTLTITALKKM